ncbi:YVTN repeat-like/Quino protein amine dehydrogenase [Armillaria solidipes]|uniref:YVTN repeat-like/Quino protein amine dehydrogenase n=1 Tax=Armillaria solidipes TaxID=1076256 RepID=A0A2H3C6B2_9AGAR|nr:YVTN repeat-like/Quino protein amine dehydrogenase [Armillaria solidipes]
MDFTAIYKQSASLVAFSPAGNLILTAAQDRLIVRRTDTFQIVRTSAIDASPSPTNASLPQLKALSGDNRITHAAWSSDSEYMLAACARKGVVHVYKLHDEKWHARVDAGAEGLAKAEWAPDGRSILCFSEWGLRVTIWSLITGSATYIQFPLHLDKGYAFRSDGRYFVLAERHRSKDTLGLYDAADGFKLARHFPLPTSSLSSFALSPNGNHLAAWEGPLEYKVFILTLAGEVLAKFTPDPDPGFGVRNVAWHPSGNFLAVGGWDDKVHILDNLSWSPVRMLELSSRISAGVNVWREPADWLTATEGRGFLSYEKLPSPHSITLTKPDHTKPNPKSGVIQMEWNLTGSLLLVRFETTPTIVHIFDFPAPDAAFVPRLRSLLIHSRPVRSAKWNPVRKGSLAICCGSPSLYTWSDEWIGESGSEEEIAECVGVPAKNFDTRDIRWAPDGKGLILLDKETFCCSFEVEDDDS